jgi:HD-GYP domain-containing protein (c-di-GMP phosphodiesterase class II)
MQFCALSTVKQRITLGAPLPFNVRDADRTLLLARGQVIDSEVQMLALLERGALVDVEELTRGLAELPEAPVETLPALWDRCLDRLGSVLRASVHVDFMAALDDASRPVRSLIERDPDLAIFQVVRQDAHARSQYGVVHSLHTAIASQLAAQRLGWDAARRHTLVNAALTMNLSMLELQGRLAAQLTPPTPAQREEIRSHPLRSVEILQGAGVDDAQWLQAVAHHHEAPSGAGYPQGVSDAGEMASLLRRADIYTAKLSPRASRDALAANQAARDMFVHDQRHPMTAALVKEFGVYPPGCCVMLASGETGLVVKRGETANTPIVASLTNRHGEPMLEPLRRNTASPEHAIVKVVSESHLRVRVSVEQLARMGSTRPLDGMP